MAISAAPALDSKSTLAPASSTPSIAETEQRFLKLLTTQLNNQDPTNPLDNAQLTSQLAQMSTVSGIEKLNAAFQSLVTQSSSTQVLQAASMIGHGVLVPGNELALSNGEQTLFGIDMQGAAQAVDVTIADGGGNTVRTYKLGALPEGTKTLMWDGKGDNGVPVADGKYSISVTAMAGDKAVAANSLNYSQVVSVAQNVSGVSLDLSNGGKANLSSVKQIL